MGNNPSGNTHLPAEKKKARRSRSQFGKKLSALSRWLHIYLSMVSFITLLFFAVTGLTLNHAERFGNNPKIYKYTGTMNLKWVRTKDTLSVARLEIVEFLRKNNGIKGSVSDFRIDDNNISVSFNGPGYSADTYIDRNDGRYELNETRFGLVAILNDLHKGRDTGKSWSAVIDIAAIFLSLVSITGLIMIFFMKKKRFSGLLLALIGLMIVYAVYSFFVE